MREFQRSPRALSAAVLTLLLAVLSLATGSVYFLSGQAATLSDGTTIPDPASTPNFSLQSGAYRLGQQLTISSTTPGAQIIFTIDGTTPSPTGTAHPSPYVTHIEQEMNIRAIALAEGFTMSPEATAHYTVDLTLLEPASAPNFSLTEGAYPLGQQLTISSTTPGAQIIFTIDGTTPSPTGTAHPSPYVTHIEQAMNIRAIALAEGFTMSPEATAHYTLSPTATGSGDAVNTGSSGGGSSLPTAAKPVFSPAGNDYDLPQTVTIKSSTTGAKVYYTLDGSVPSSSSALYTEPITIKKNTVVRALALAPNFHDSAAVAAEYHIRAAIPNISPESGTYTGAQTIELRSDVEGAKLYYTTDESEPTVQSTLYAGAFTVAQNTVVKAIAVAAGYLNSLVSKAAYTITAAAVLEPTANNTSATAVTGETAPANPTGTDAASPAPATDTGTGTSQTAAVPAAGATAPAPQPAAAPTPAKTSSSAPASPTAATTTGTANTGTDSASGSQPTGSPFLSAAIDFASKMNDACPDGDRACQLGYVADAAEDTICEGLSEEACSAKKNEYAEKFLALEEKYERIKERADAYFGQTITIDTLESAVLGDADAGSSAPLDNRQTRVKLMRAVANATLDEAAGVIEAAPLALALDADGDGLPDDTEKRIGTDPAAADTDQDGYPDGEEIRNGYDPLGPGRRTIELSDIDQAFLLNQTLEHPKLSGTTDASLSVSGITNAQDASYLLTGQADPGSVLTLYIYSDIPVVTTVTTDEFGNWEYHFSQPLSSGDHEVYVAINDNTGKVVSKSSPLDFFINEAKAVSPKDLADTGDTTTGKIASDLSAYYLFTAAALIFVGILVFLFAVLRQKNNNPA